MAKLLVFNKDAKADEAFKRGDVVGVFNDAEDDGGLARNGALLPDGSRVFWWRLIRVPGDKSLYESLLTTDRGAPQVEGEEGVIRRMRATKLDLDAIEQAEVVRVGKALAASDEVHIATRGALTARIVEKPAMADPIILDPRRP